MPSFIPLSKPGLTASMIMGQTPAITHSRARYVRVASVRMSPSDAGQSFRANTRTVKNDDGTARAVSETYVTTIVLLNRYGHILVDCTCAYHPFWGAEVALSLRKAAEIIRSNGRPPKIRNPSLVPLCCKHAVSFIRQLQAAGKLKG